MLGHSEDSVSGIISVIGVRVGDPQASAPKAVAACPQPALWASWVRLETGLTLPAQTEAIKGQSYVTL